MNNYKLKIQGMHCSGCRNLITMSLEDEGLVDVNVDLELNEASFQTAKSETEVKEIVDKVFSELKDYKYLELTKEGK
jgi:copper chaperone CopZ